MGGTKQPAALPQGPLPQGGGALKHTQGTLLAVVSRNTAAGRHPDLPPAAACCQPPVIWVHLHLTCALGIQHPFTLQHGESVAPASICRAPVLFEESKSRTRDTEASCQNEWWILARVQLSDEHWQPHTRPWVPLLHCRLRCTTHQSTPTL